ncbi:GNAT family N-acetyltransferase [Hoeflea ulvae]|uniref:N-acetyltransferase n=1 Tax=Hoeflea ulvae TaxID=2983764 RepID=A0ABT3Y9Q6_9HYPH|nr:N-acetyltransferase [Hoeflea ulvae]MCY0092621.1 N-acetyltransferase [Hoeflea ulvae]
MSDRNGIAARTSYRESGPADLAAIQALESIVYANAAAGLSAGLINGQDETLSCVAELDGQIIGHILMVEVTGPDRALALAPHAILPAWRDMQIGTELVRFALDLARRRDWHSVFVFGQPDYFCRFGFRSDTADCAETPAQGSRFLALELRQAALAGWSGRLDYPQAFVELAVMPRRQ